MDEGNQKSLERVVSQKALQMGSSYSCQICVMGFVSGICMTTLFLAALTSFGGDFGLGLISFPPSSLGIASFNSSPHIINCRTKPKETERLVQPQATKAETDNEKVSLLSSAWDALLTEPEIGENEFLDKFKVTKSSVPNAPHLENCKMKEEVSKHLDMRARNRSLPPWTNWKGLLDMYPAAGAIEKVRLLSHQALSGGAYPPWIGGSIEENYPLTGKVQHDIWIHQHPADCHDPNVRFLIADWERIPGFGIGAQIAGMCGLLAIAIKEKRVLVTNYYNRADHDGCKGSSRASLSCYFFPETSQECRERAFELAQSAGALEKGIITQKENYSSKKIWAGKPPREWGAPWSYLQPTTEINGSLLTFHQKMDLRWWRAQAVRYIMRFQTKYTCGLLNIARHAAFGKEAAQIVLASLGGEWPKEATNRVQSEIEEFVWSNHKPWMPRPLLSMHVRMGDKACEMKVAEFEEYMRLADRIRSRFPHVQNIWLSTEMQEVIDKSKLYPKWKFYYTKVRRQVGNGLMAKYEASLGRERSTNYPLVNFLMATEADFFVGALGSTWCFLIDGMRNTGGKVMSGYLSVNKDRFW